MHALFIRRVLPSLHFGLLVLALSSTTKLHASDLFMKPTQEELAMTSLPGYPGAAAVVLYKEEQTKDDLHVVQHYERIKILTEEGKKYANVELRFFTAHGGFDYQSDETMVGDIVGRTIHPDGSIIPFTGKPYLKVIEKGSDAKFQQKMFTLPDVTVGSIIEYRYAKRFSDRFYEAPSWFIQNDLFVKSARYTWYPTAQVMQDAQGRPVNSISWFPLLPAGVTIKRTESPRTSSSDSSGVLYEVSVKDVPPEPKEEHMPPLENFTYRVLFNYTSYRTADEYWKSEGKQWSKHTDSFIGSSSNMKKAADEITAGATTEDDKLKKIYAVVMSMENTEFTRQRGKKEEKVNNASDVLANKRGTPTQLTDAFIGLARGAGLKAYAMLVPDRSRNIFVPMWLNIDQFDDEIAIVTVDGKDRFFDPGDRYCPYGQLAWQHTIVKGLRQTDSGTDFAQSGSANYAANKTARVANLTMDEHGEVTGKIDLSFLGAPALRWRHAALEGDTESIHHSLEKELEEMIPGSMEVKVTNIQNLDDYEKPLAVTYSVKGSMSTVTGKRLVLPVDLFLTGETATFTHEKRETPVYFHYPESVVDALRINLPKNVSIEAIPDASKIPFNQEGLYALTVESTPTNVTVRRTFLLNDVVVLAKDYGDLRSFYSKFEAKDKDSMVLKTAPVQTSMTAPAGN